MKKVKALFTRGSNPRESTEKYESGKVYDLSPDQVEKWERRGAITTDPEAIANAGRLPEKEKEPDQPDLLNSEPEIRKIGNGKFEVIGTDGSKLNAVPLTEKQAKDFVANLKAPGEKAPGNPDDSVSQK
jgi:hypothetical protein